MSTGDCKDRNLCKENDTLGVSQRNQAHRSSFRRSTSRIRNHKNNALFNVAISLALFFALIQVFDPTVQRRIERDIGHLNEIRSPMAQSLEDFSRGKNANSRQNKAIALNSRPADEVNRLDHDRITTLLDDAGILQQLSDRQLKEVPKWDQVVDLFGNEVVIVGKEDCPTFRSLVPLKRRRLGVAGMFNTGTNLLEAQFRMNIRMPQPILWQVPWGKHRMADVRLNHTASGMEYVDKSDVLPVVMIRDPYAWLQSMCNAPYAANWRHGKHHCPNLIPSDGDHQRYSNLNEVFQVTVKFDKQSQRHFDSLVHLWSEWYKEYLDVDYPILMVRFEDLIFQPVTVLQEIADCVEGKVHTPIQYQLNSSKAHGSGTNYVKALVKTADIAVRSKNMTSADLKYAATNLDRHLMEIFQYRIAPQLDHEKRPS